jgi:hypothetical protein
MRVFLKCSQVLLLVTLAIAGQGCADFLVPQVAKMPASSDGSGTSDADLNPGHQLSTQFVAPTEHRPGHPAAH